ncbi:MAG: Tex-like N-terminal domain-containing protein, partial [Moraxellaceae bacterium]
MLKNNFVHNSIGLALKSVTSTLALLSEGATVPFISRYRKEMTGGLDEVEISAIRDVAKQYDEITARQQTILNALIEQGKWTEELAAKITNCFDAVLLEDIYLPFKQKRLTRGEKARKLGLEPLAKMIMSQKGGVPEVMAERFVKGEVNSEEEALQGAIDIIAEWINENAVSRDRLRQTFQRKAILNT